ncbi:Rho-binding antiterminator [uncultured Psychromonas sp.]|uniref:Rho-binding antiterminator n=1 Tax=uncultured Psychromonas sp. TaxID=173974 RepID=UPI00261BCB68|nr:Rho-binding antiterminator [uncultured Psychromonas sp.]
MISCHQYDYIEIVCMYHYPVKLTLKSGQIIEGIALDTARNDAREECIKLDDKGVAVYIVLSDITLLSVDVENPHIKQVSFV